MKDDKLFLKYKKALAEYPDKGRPVREGFYVQWHITDTCNLRCKHCYYSDAPVRDLSFEQLQDIFKKFLKTMLKWKVKGFLCLTGGEPLLRKDFFDLMDYIHTKWKEHPVFAVPLMSNGVLVNEEFLSRLEPYKEMLTQIQVSLDGAHKETHDFIRGRGSFEKAKNALRLFKENGHGTALHFVVSKSNYKDAFDIMELGEELKVTRVTVSRLVPEGRGCGLEMISPSELRDLWVYLSDKGLDSVVKGVYLARGRCDLWHLADIPSSLYSLKWGRKEGKLPPLLQVGQRCPVGVNGLTIETDGTVFGCRRLPIPLGNITEDTFFKIWFTSKLMWKFRYKEKHMKGKCRDCPFLTDEELRGLCAGGSPCISYAEYGDCFEPDPQCWFDPYSEEQLKEVEEWRKLISEQGNTFLS